MIDELYSARLLSLAANVTRLGRLSNAEGSAEKVSKLCGSRILVDVSMEDGRVADFAQEVKACALGQASASILADRVIGATPKEIEVARDALRAMLKADGSPPTGRFSDLAMLEPVKDYPPRHASTLLAFEAAAEACRRAEDSRRTSAADAA